MMPCRFLSGALRAAALALACGSALAAPPPPKWPEVRVTMQAQERPLREFLHDLFGSIGMRVSVSEGVGGKVSARFNDKPEAIFNQLVQSNNLLPYFDGAVMHVAGADEISGKSIAVAPGDGRAVVAGLARLGIPNQYQSLQLVGDGRLIKVRGSREFVQDVEDLVQSRRRTPEEPLDAATAAFSAAADKGRSNARSEAPAQPPAAEAAAGPTIVRSFALKYASAADLVLYQNGQPVTVPGMATMLNTMLGDGSVPSTYPGTGSRSNTNLEKLRGRGLRRYGTSNADEPAAEPVPAAARVDAGQGKRRGGARIAADRTLNAVVVRDAAETMPMYEQLIADLDKSPQLIEIQVTIVDIDKNRLSDIGFDWRYQDSRSSARLGGGGQVPLDAGGLLFNTVLGDARRFFARINALASEGAARVSSQPQVLTISNMEAMLTNDQSFYVRVAGNQDVDLFNVTAGTSLRVTPFVVGDAANPQIRLTVTIEDGRLSEQAQVDGLPVVDRNSLNTQAVLFNGENLLLGGLVRERDETQTDKLPLLGDVPVVGKLFQRTTKTQTRTERLYLITPRLVTDNRATRPAAPVSPDPSGVPPARPASTVRPAATAEGGHG